MDDDYVYLVQVPHYGFCILEWEEAFEPGERLVAAGSMEACEAAIRLMRSGS